MYPPVMLFIFLDVVLFFVKDSVPLNAMVPFGAEWWLHSNGRIKLAAAQWPRTVS
jgi:hypothetical protein